MFLAIFAGGRNVLLSLYSLNFSMACDACILEAFVARVSMDTQIHPMSLSSVATSISREDNEIELYGKSGLVSI